MNTKINVLPVPTWNHLGVNWADQSAALPERQADGFGTAFFAVGEVPVGIEQAEAFPRCASGWESGVGSAYDQYVMENANVRANFIIKGQAEQPLRLTACVTAAHPHTVGSYGVYAQRGGSATVLQTACSEEGAQGFTAELTKIYAEQGATVRLVQVQKLNEQCRAWNAVAIYAEEGAKVEVVRATLGGSVAACGAKAYLVGKESSFALTAVYFADGTQRFDFNDVAEHRGAFTESEMHTAGVLAGKGAKILRGTIDFKRGCPRSVGHESENVLMLGKQVRNRTVPLILCGEEKVEGQHAATIGRLDEEQMYYLCSRGLTVTQARKLLVEGRFAPVIDRVPDAELREELTAQIERRLAENERCEG